MSIEIIAFDIFGTVVDMSDVPREELIAYGQHIRQPEYSPLRLPDSWANIPAHPDSAEGLYRLRKKYITVTLSNGPLGLLTRLSKNNHLEWDAVFPVEMAKSFKPNPEPYRLLADAFYVDPSKVMMVTANKTFGDLEASAAIGMTPQLIRGESSVPDIVALAHKMGC